MQYAVGITEDMIALVSQKIKQCCNVYIDVASAEQLLTAVAPLIDKAQAQRIAKLEAALRASAQTLRLHLGEMTAQEMRTVRAAFSWVLAAAPAPSAGETVTPDMIAAAWRAWRARHGGNLGPAAFVEAINAALAALRRERDEHANYCADALERLAAAEADNAKKDAALREMKGWLTEADIVALSDDTRDTLAALAPAAQGEIASIYVGGEKVGEMEVPPIAPAPSAGEMRKLLAIIEIERPEAIAHAEKRLRELPNEKYDPRDSLPEEHDAALAAAPTTGETR